jgi:hypothetical protein
VGFLKKIGRAFELPLVRNAQKIDKQIDKKSKSNEVSYYFVLGLRQMYVTFINNKKSRRPLPHTGTYSVCKEPVNAQQRHRRPGSREINAVAIQHTNYHTSNSPSAQSLPQELLCAAGLAKNAKSLALAEMAAVS